MRGDSMTSMIAQSCSRKLITLYRIRLLAAGCMTALFAAAAMAFSLPRAAFTLCAAAVCICASAVVLPRLWYDRLRYTRHGEWLHIERGWLRHSDIVIPRRMLQYITVRRSPLERPMGLCTLVLHTGTCTARLGGLDAQTAQRMRALLECGRR